MLCAARKRRGALFALEMGQIRAEGEGETSKR